MPKQSIEVTGLKPHDVLRALYEFRSHQRAPGSPALVIEVANLGKPLPDTELIEEISVICSKGYQVDERDYHHIEDFSGCRVRLPDYFRGTPIKVFWNSELNGTQWIYRTDLYDRDHGEGRCQEIIDSLMAVKVAMDNDLGMVVLPPTAPSKPSVPPFPQERITVGGVDFHCLNGLAGGEEIKLLRRQRFGTLRADEADRDWHTTRGGTPNKEAKHGGRLICGDCAADYENGGGPSCVYVEELSPEVVRFEIAKLRDPQNGLQCGICEYLPRSEEEQPSHYERTRWLLDTPFSMLLEPKLNYDRFGVQAVCTLDPDCGLWGDDEEDSDDEG